MSSETRRAASSAAAIGLEPIDLEHALAVQALASDPAIGATSNVPWPYPPGEAVTFIRAAARHWRAGTDYVLAVTAEGRLVGVCSLLSVGGAPRSAELGYWIGRPYWGRGYATAAARRVVAFGFRDLGLALVRSSCLPENPASRRVLEKIGFRRTGVGGNAHPKWDRDRRFLLFELDAAEAAAGIESRIEKP